MWRLVWWLILSYTEWLKSSHRSAAAAAAAAAAVHLQEDLFDPCASVRTPASESDIRLQESDAVRRPVLSDGGKVWVWCSWHVWQHNKLTLVSLPEAPLAWSDVKSKETESRLRSVCKWGFVLFFRLFRAVMAEWLRRWIRNPMGIPRAGSNPAHSDEASFNQCIWPKQQQPNVGVNKTCLEKSACCDYEQNQRRRYIIM